MRSDDFNRYSDRTRQIAVYLQEKIYEEGLPAVRFSDAARDEMSRRATTVFRKNLRSKLKKK